jgi:hypothetical protein
VVLLGGIHTAFIQYDISDFNVFSGYANKGFLSDVITGFVKFYFRQLPGRFSHPSGQIREILWLLFELRPPGELLP